MLLIIFRQLTDLLKLEIRKLLI